jgi:hypothetical protein
VIPNSIKVGLGSEAVFPRGVLFMGVEAATDFDLKGKTDDIQMRDPVTGQRVWTVTGVDMEEPDESARRRTAEVKIKLVAPHRPVPPASRVPGYPPLVEFEGLTVTPWVDRKPCTGPEQGKSHRCWARQAYSMWATGMRAFTGSPSTDS